MKKRVLIKGPVLTRSGYGEQTRFLLRSLRSREDLFDIYVQPLEWGQTSWISESTEERQWIDHAVEKTIGFLQNQGSFDASIQITIPNEWEKMAPVNIGYTAGIESTRVAHEWILKSNEMDRVIVISQHAKYGFGSTKYSAVNTNTNENMVLEMSTPVDVVNYPVRKFDNNPIDLNLDFDFNFLCVAQMGPRKNVANTIKWFIEEFKNDEVGLVLKSNRAKNCLADRIAIFETLKSIIAEYDDRKCKVYLLHGDMTDEEMNSLYLHPKIKSFVLLTHGEGFGLPTFEAAYSGLPTVTTGWSGQLDFLVDAGTGSDMFYNVAYDIQPIQPEAAWEGVLVKESMWAFPREASAKHQMRKCYEDLTGDDADSTIAKFANYAEKINDRFSAEKMYAQMVDSVCTALNIESNPGHHNVDLVAQEVLSF